MKFSFGSSPLAPERFALCVVAIRSIGYELNMEYVLVCIINHDKQKTKLFTQTKPTHNYICQMFHEDGSEKTVKHETKISFHFSALAVFVCLPRRSFREKESTKSFRKHNHAFCKHKLMEHFFPRVQ